MRSVSPLCLIEGVTKGQVIDILTRDLILKSLRYHPPRDARSSPQRVTLWGHAVPFFFLESLVPTEEKLCDTERRTLKAFHVHLLNVNLKHYAFFIQTSGNKAFSPAGFFVTFSWAIFLLIL
jgi:hypothetical protein